MKVVVLGSGSKGNSTYIQNNNTIVLIDIGLSISTIEKKLSEINISPEAINAILITHNHEDHIRGLKAFCKKYNTKVYLTEDTLTTLKTTKMDYIIYDKENIIEELNVKIIKTSHDAKGSVGFIIKSENKELVYITDTGYINYKNLEKIINKDMYIFESNHDIEMLMNGKYHYYLKQRILSDKGHLSNVDSARYLAKIVGDKTKNIVLAHLSAENNKEELVMNEILKALEKSNKVVEKITIAKQDSKTDIIEI